MDILTHILSGVAIGSVVSSFSEKGFMDRVGLYAVTGFAAALPDIDAISLWSKFDNLIGRYLDLNHSGKEIYFSKLWYSHHGFLHSLLAIILIILILGSLSYLIKSRCRNFSLKALFQNFKKIQLYLISFLLGFIIHLLEDMPTPASFWGGIDFLWPSKYYIGGTGDIWWWNNYDIFLVAFSIILINTIVLTTNRILKIDTRKITIVIILIGITLVFFQIKTRGFDFSYTGYTSKFDNYEAKSKEIQRQILGDKMYRLMDSFDKKIPFNF
jgi:inner membrane protein